MRLIDDIQFVRTLEEGIVFGTHSIFNHCNEFARIDVLVCTNHQCGPSALIMGCQRRDAQHLLDSILREALFLQAYSCKRMHHVLSARAGHHSFDLNTDQPSATLFCSDGMSEESINL